MDFGKCETRVNNKKILLKDKRSKSNIKMYFLNKKQSYIRKIAIDGCVLEQETSCDFLMIPIDIDVEYLIELKGHNIEQALKQLKATIEKVSKDKKKQYKLCFIITTRSPITSAEIQNYQKQFKRQYNSKLIVKESGYEHKI